MRTACHARQTLGVVGWLFRGSHGLRPGTARRELEHTSADPEDHRSALVCPEHDGATIAVQIDGGGSRVPVVVPSPDADHRDVGVQQGGERPGLSCAAVMRNLHDLRWAAPVLPLELPSEHLLGLRLDVTERHQTQLRCGDQQHQAGIVDGRTVGVRDRSSTGSVSRRGRPQNLPAHVADGARARRPRRVDLPGGEVTLSERVGDHAYLLCGVGVRSDEHLADPPACQYLRQAPDVVEVKVGQDQERDAGHTESGQAAVRSVPRGPGIDHDGAPRPRSHDGRVTLPHIADGNSPARRGPAVRAPREQQASRRRTEHEGEAQRRDAQLPPEEARDAPDRRGERDQRGCHKSQRDRPGGTAGPRDPGAGQACAEVRHLSDDPA